MARVLAQDIAKQFKSVIALDHVTVEFEQGKLTVLVGPSGCGKTTLLRIVAGLEDPTTGDIYIGERRMNDVPPWHRNTAMVFQNYALYPHMSVFDNIAYPLKRSARRGKRSRIESRGLPHPLESPSCCGASRGAFRGADATGRRRAGNRAQARGFPDGRTALQP